MRTFELKSGSLASFFEIIEAQHGKYRHLFRGQASASWDLRPALYRRDCGNIGAATLEDAFEFYEQRCIEIFFREGLPYLPQLKRSFANDRILAQHFGVPTRLLDWSRDPLVALYFAVEDWDDGTDAAVFLIAPEAHYPSDLLSAALLKDATHQVVSIAPPAIDRRIPAQKSVFTVHPYGPPTGSFVSLDQRADIGNTFHTGDVHTRGFAKIIIPARVRRNLYQTLLGLGIDRRNLFPGLEGVGEDVARRASSGQVL